MDNWQRAIELGISTIHSAYYWKYVLDDIDILRKNFEWTDSQCEELLQLAIQQMHPYTFVDAVIGFVQKQRATESLSELRLYFKEQRIFRGMEDIL